MKERDDTFIKMAGRRVIPYLRFQRLLIGLYTVMMVFGGVLFVVNYTGECCINNRCTVGISDLVPQHDLLCLSSSQNVEHEDPRLYAHFLATLLFSFATLFVARGVKRGERMSLTGLRRMVCAMLKCDRILSPWRFDAATDEPASTRIPRQAFSVMIRHVPVTMNHKTDGVHRDLQMRMTEYCHSVGRDWEVLDVSVHATEGAATCTAFVTFKQAISAQEFVASHRAKYKREFLQVRRWKAVDRPGVVRLPMPPQEFDMEEWQVSQGPDPADVEWDYLNLSGLESSLRTLLSFSILMPIAILLSFTIPIATQVADISNVFFRQIQLTQFQLRVPQSQVAGGLQKVLIDRECGESCALMSKYFPTLIQVILNIGLVPAVIDLLAPFEGHYLRNQLYRSVLRKNIVIMFFTILICPTITLATANDLVVFVQQWWYSVQKNGEPSRCGGESPVSGGWLGKMDAPISWASDSLGQAFLEDSGPFFMLFMLQATTLGTAAALSLFPLAGWTCCNFCLPGCLLGHRRILWEFPVEFNYTLCLVSYAVVLTYSVAFPSITLIGWFFGVLRHWTDRYTLLFAHQGNLDRHFADEDDEEGTEKRRRSEVFVCNTVGNTLLFSVVLFDVSMLGFFKIKDPKLFLAMVIIMFVVFIYTIYKSCEAVHTHPTQRFGSDERPGVTVGDTVQSPVSPRRNSPVGGTSTAPTFSRRTHATDRRRLVSPLPTTGCTEPLSSPPAGSPPVLSPFLGTWPLPALALARRADTGLRAGSATAKAATTARAPTTGPVLSPATSDDLNASLLSDAPSDAGDGERTGDSSRSIRFASDISSSDGSSGATGAVAVPSSRTEPFAQSWEASPRNPQVCPPSRRHSWPAWRSSVFCCPADAPFNDVESGRGEQALLRQTDHATQDSDGGTRCAAVVPQTHTSVAACSNPRVGRSRLNARGLPANAARSTARRCVGASMFVV